MTTIAGIAQMQRFVGVSSMTAALLGLLHALFAPDISKMLLSNIDAEKPFLLKWLQE